MRAEKRKQLIQGGATFVALSCISVFMLMTNAEALAVQALAGISWLVLPLLALFMVFPVESRSTFRTAGAMDFGVSYRALGFGGSWLLCVLAGVLAVNVFG